MIAMPLTANRVEAALSDRTWTIDGLARCHLFLLLSGRARLTHATQIEVEIAAPSLVWWPQAGIGALRIMAGGEGFAASVGRELVQASIGDPALTLHLRPLLDRVVLAGPDMVAPHRHALASSFADLADESQERRPAAAAMTRLHLATLLLRLWRCVGVNPRTPRSGSSASTVVRFRQLIELHYREALRIDDFAARLGVTRAHLHAACLRAAGRTPLALLHDRLLAEARSRLEQTDLSVEQVGYGLGFRDPGYFNRFFKRLAGQSPGAYRRNSAMVRPAEVPSFAAWP